MNNLTLPSTDRPPERHLTSRLRYPWLIASLAAIALLSAACGSSASSPTTTKATPTGSGATARAVKLASATLPSVGSVLTGPSGMTLYYFTTDSPSSTTCTGQCAVVWPPLEVPAGSTPTLSSSISGTVATISRPDGTTQVTYKGHPLYYYRGHTAPGSDKGQGVGGTWFVLSTSNSTPASTPTTSPSGGGGGVGF